jgi:hypothetical protein
MWKLIFRGRVFTLSCAVLVELQGDHNFTLFSLWVLRTGGVRNTWAR